LEEKNFEQKATKIAKAGVGEKGKEAGHERGQKRRMPPFPFADPGV